MKKCGASSTPCPDALTTVLIFRLPRQKSATLWTPRDGWPAAVSKCPAPWRNRSSEILKSFCSWASVLKGGSRGKRIYRASKAQQSGNIPPPSLQNPMSFSLLRLLFLIREAAGPRQRNLVWYSDFESGLVFVCWLTGGRSGDRNI